jgi:2-dehydropantoate 2-reductase
MKVLVIGAGVIGSFNAAQLKKGGVDVTLLARGRRLAQLREHGVVLEGAFSGRRSVTLVPLVDRLDPDDAYDLAIVVLRRNQIPSVLPMLVQNRKIPTVLFLGNNTAGQEDIIAALGRERLLIGVVNAGGERNGYVVRFIHSRRTPVMLSELDGRPSPRAEAIVHMFKQAGLDARLHKNVDAFLKTHAAGLPGLAGALYMCGGDVRRLARTPAALRLWVRSYREALRALRAIGVPIVPWSTQFVEWIPEPMLVLVLRFFLDTNLAVVGAQGHANAAPDEMEELTNEVRGIMDRAGVACPASEALFPEVDKRFHATEQSPSPPLTADSVTAA